jgi:methionyl-tRNA formyltransferase
MRVVAIVNGYTGALCVQELVNQGDDVVGVVTSPGDPGPGDGVHRPDPETSVKLTADRNYLPVYQPQPAEVNTPAFIEMLRKLQPDLIVSMHYALIFKEALLRIPPLGCVNEHPSRLPAGRGMTPAFWHMLVGDTRNWITLHYLDPGIDTGDVISQGSVEITAEDTGMTSARKLSQEGRRLLAEALPLIRAGQAPRIPQRQIAGVAHSYYSWKPHYARLAWERPALELALQVRTLTHPKEARSWTGCAYTHLAGRKVSIWQAEAMEAGHGASKPAQPGDVLAVTGQGLLVQAGAGVLLVRDADIEGAQTPGLAGLFPFFAPGLPVTLS